MDPFVIYQESGSDYPSVRDIVCDAMYGRQCDALKVRTACLFKDVVVLLFVVIIEYQRSSYSIAGNI